jgi:hypothetical protein
MARLNLKNTLTRGNGAKRERSKVLPDVPSALFARHHLPCLSVISRISPFVKDSSLGWSGDAVSEGVMKH